MSEIRTISPENFSLEPCQADIALLSGEYPKLPFKHELEKAIAGYDRLGVDTRENMLAHCQKVIGSVQSFAGMELPPLAITAIYLHDIVDRQLNLDSNKFTQKRQAIASSLIRDLFQRLYPTITSEELEYIGGILTSFVLTEIASGEHRKGVVDRSTIVGGTVNNSTNDKVAGLYRGDLDEIDWKTIEPYLDFSHINKVTKRLNIEAILIKGNELLVNLREPSSKRQSAWLQDVLEAESFYAPILEVVGYAGLASSLRSQAHIVRLNGQGKNDIVKKAEGVIDKISEVGVDAVLSEIFGHGNSAIQPVVGVDPSNNNKRPIEMGEFVTILNETSQYPAAGLYRLKTVGSLGNKMANERYNGELPMDVLGFTFISGKHSEAGQEIKESIDDIRQSSREFAVFVKKIIDGKPTLKCAKSHARPIIIEGSGKYISIVADELRAQGVDLKNCEFSRDSKRDRRKRGYARYTVSKVTFLVDMGEGLEVPVEAQFVTKAERERARTGEVAHIIYKYIGQLLKTNADKEISDKEKLDIVNSATQLLKEMHVRRSYLNPDSLELNGRTVEEAIDYIFSVLCQKDFKLAT